MTDNGSSKAVNVGVYDETTKSDVLNPVLCISYRPAAWIGRNVRGPVAHHQIRGRSEALDVLKRNLTSEI